MFHSISAFARFSSAVLRARARVDTGGNWVGSGYGEWRDVTGLGASGCRLV